MNKYYECHVTMIGNVNDIEVDVNELGWKFSKIDGDPILGEGIKCYATKHYPIKISPEEVVKNVKSVANILRMNGHYIIRDKVELVIYDSKLVNI